MTERVPWYWPDESNGPTIRGDVLGMFDQDFWERRYGANDDGEDD